MPYIKTISPEHALGKLKSEYDAALRRAGRIWNIVSIMSLNADVLQSSMRFYSALMHGASRLSRAQREMLATVVSQINHCYY